MGIRTLVAAAAVAGLGSSALAASTVASTEIQFDWNSITADADVASGTTFDTNFTGTIDLFSDSNSFLQVAVDGAGAPSVSPAATLDGAIVIDNGGITGGFFTITAGADQYTADIVSGSGVVNQVASNDFNIDGLTFNGAFNGLSFAGIDVSAFDAAEPFGGDFIQFDFSPNASGIDTGADLDVFAVIPLPHPAALAGMGLACVGLVSRRRLG